MTAPFNNAQCIIFKLHPPPNISFFVMRFPYSLSPTSSRAQHNRVSWKSPATLSEIRHHNIKAALVNRERNLKLLVDGDIDKASQSQWEFRLSYRVLSPVPHVRLALCYSRSTLDPPPLPCLVKRLHRLPPRRCPGIHSAKARQHAVEGLLHLSAFAALVPSLSSRRLFAG